MAVELIDDIRRYIGLAADSKPTSPPIGSEFYEYDSARTFVYAGAAWNVKPNSFWRYANKEITFAGATPNAIGDFDGEGNPADVFTITGIVKIKLVPVCTTDIVFAANATIELGVFGDTGVLIPTTDLTISALDVNEFWFDATPTTILDTLANASLEYVISASQDIILTCGVANTNTGVILFNCEWMPISSDGLVVAA